MQSRRVIYETASVQKFWKVFRVASKKKKIIPRAHRWEVDRFLEVWQDSRGQPDVSRKPVSVGCPDNRLFRAKFSVNRGDTRGSHAHLFVGTPVCGAPHPNGLPAESETLRLLVSFHCRGLSTNNRAREERARENKFVSCVLRIR